MKKILIFLVIFSLLIPLQTVSAARGPKQNIIILTADQVTNAIDIEAAIISATAEGTRFGTVILDGSKGPFVYAGDDRSLNIFVPNLTLRGDNLAIIQNCDGGLSFDDFPLKNILVEGIAFDCEGDAVSGSGAFRNVTLRNNIFLAAKNGIIMEGASSDWTITDNLIEANGDGIVITGAKKVGITNNYISGNIGIVIRQASEFHIRKNIIHAAYQGILLVEEQWSMIQANSILGVSNSGIALESGVVGNLIVANRVFCAPGASCLTIDASPEMYEKNTIAGNRP